jgi:hypothetical protein
MLTSKRRRLWVRHRRNATQGARRVAIRQFCVIWSLLVPACGEQEESLNRVGTAPTTSQPCLGESGSGIVLYLEQVDLTTNGRISVAAILRNESREALFPDGGFVCMGIPGQLRIRSLEDDCAYAIGEPAYVRRHPVWNVHTLPAGEELRFQYLFDTTTHCEDGMSWQEYVLLKIPGDPPTTSRPDDVNCLPPGTYRASTRACLIRFRGKGDRSTLVFPPDIMSVPSENELLLHVPNGWKASTGKEKANKEREKGERRGPG